MTVQGPGKLDWYNLYDFPNRYETTCMSKVNTKYLWNIHLSVFVKVFIKNMVIIHRLWYAVSHCTGRVN